VRPNAFFAFVDRVHHRWRDWVLTGLTLITVSYLFIIVPIEAELGAPIRPIGYLFVVMLATSLLILSRSILPLCTLAVALTLLGASAVLTARGGNPRIDMGIQAIAWLLVGLVIAWVVGRAAFAAGRITYHRVLGAVLLYLSFGLIFVAFYTLAGAFQPNAFSGVIIGERLSLPGDLVYFSFATLTTVGYGDITPVKPLVRSLSNLEAIIGQLYPATLLARLVSLGQENSRNSTTNSGKGDA
jgi:hypothetical protein